MIYAMVAYGSFRMWLNAWVAGISV